MVELLSPVGDFECLKAAVQNGADAVYLGSSSFSARASAKNFDLEELKEAICYAKLRNVKVHLALNTLVKNDEINDALRLAKAAYELGIDAIIVQDYGLCWLLSKYLPDLPIHASTQMSIHNLEGVKELETLGFSRAVLSRELSLSELQFIKSNTNIELEVFVHGALCISYSGQCLLSSMIGGRSGNRGKCAQACRLPYELVVQSNKEICMDKGYLLSPRDLCGLSYLPDLVQMGISSFKIEGRMKTPEYVATVTRIYRKYIDLALSSKEYVIDEKDQKDLLQVFNRGGFSTGHLGTDPNKDLVYKEKQNHMGIYIGNVASYQATKGHITLNLNDELEIGDTISFEKESSKYHISELMIGKQNHKKVAQDQVVTIGRMKGNIHPGDKIYKLESKSLSEKAKSSYQVDHKKLALTCSIIIQKDTQVRIKVTGPQGIKASFTSSILPVAAVNHPITKERIIAQFCKTGDTPFVFEKIAIKLDENLYLNISDLNELRRKTLQEAYQLLVHSFEKKIKNEIPEIALETQKRKSPSKKISLLLNNLDPNTNYSELEEVDRIYLPLKYFLKNDYANIIKNICLTYDTYIYMPNIIKANYRNLFATNIDTALEEYPVKGFVLSNLGSVKMLEKYKDQYEFIGNYSLNVLNNTTISSYHDLGINELTLSAELNKNDIIQIAESTPIPIELMVYGNLPVMTLGYCLLGRSNKCYPNCKALCNSKHQYYLKDRLGFYFPISSDNTQTINTIYNSKITSLAHFDLPVNSVRIDILDENLLQINEIIQTVRTGNRFEGKDYTNGNFIRDI